MIAFRNDHLEELNDMLREQAEMALRANQSLKNDLIKTQDELKRFSNEREIERNLVRQNDAVIIFIECIHVN